MIRYIFAQCDITVVSWKLHSLTVQLPDKSYLLYAA